MHHLFLDIEAIKGRIRIVGEIEDILMDKIHQNLDKVKLVLLSRQGKLSRALFNYIQSNQLIIESELLEIAKMQMISGLGTIGLTLL